MATAPFVRIGGTGRPMLTAGFEKAVDALDLAVKAVEETAPNMRDFHPDEARFVQAMREHRARLEAVTKARDELNELWADVEVGIA